ncbi:hypothetical protein BATDEDRAFT_88454 [Batrachochytrium dendrobatidis JAM81]|uniref:glutaminase n=1 Tax=Batrachochytrium dendrobatidis (strain JAM81 / FGSC 10211) TaxID=684364 RepID=F4P276_BATDJ|nr:uncharacterized protein BATDEDRAFT_88454 [Batrachochytrium dendrobatidis JAM81]EGF80807.1 hypothetical protein BATDEDRAFT_88454 [Batrachochytrium dendrobatidis JAM81]KAJ8329114.1 Senecionine N-oxygenase [Batrachochytrium dendrobatidis]KAK5669060.1 Senecionine N-oxygenase [Batrachochytrium dendrobatidis]|eukprot:XP_006678705.1 hypothetical protein BATDEDRAFT_88454 [Batrachochytrium dendrobatidis JAM81]
MDQAKPLRIGVLALQGAFSEHINILNRMSQWVDMAIPIRTKEQLENSCLDALILPGGESTAIALAAERNGLMEPLRQWVRSGNPIWGTCAGMILLSDTAQGTKEGGQELIGGLHVQVKRNAFGHQLDSFVECIDIPVIGDTPFQAVFIRAPLISSICVDEMAKHVTTAPVQILARVPSKDNCIVAVQQGNILATSFHPELTQDTRFHQYFVKFSQEIVLNKLKDQEYISSLCF